jgi:cold shock CspA family protein
MGRSQETFGKKDNEKKKQQKRKAKEEKREERHANAKKGQNLEDMLAYVDENGNITATPPDPTKRREVKTEEIQLGARRRDEDDNADPVRHGTVTFFNDSKGYGFIKDQQSGESIFVHANGLVNKIKENDKVTFEVERGHKGLNAVSVKLAG